ncbi:MAG: S41 family peptidase [Candidatus Promineifilaceae bacterium]|nr:S41 family peptidase [Candidatus Promineifilaceae bacterium]
MTQKTRRIFIGLVASVVIVFLCAGIGIGAYYLGRQSVEDAPTATTEVQAETATASMVEPSAEVEVDDPDEGEPAEPTSEDESVAAESDQDAQQQSGDASPTEEAVRESIDIDAADFGVMIEAWEIINREFDGQLPQEDEVVYEAIRGSLETLDDEFTRFVPPDVAARTREQLQGSFEGIGAFVENELSEEGYLVILRPIEGQPAEEAGLRSGDQVTHVDGRSVQGLSVDETITLIKGPRGTDVTLTIQRAEEEPFDVTITRALIDIPIVESELLEGDIVYVRLTSFSGNADVQVLAELDELLTADSAGIVFDLRDNPGGFLNQAVAISDIFLPAGTILIERDSEGNERVFESEDGDPAEEVPLAVLVTAGSASASEIVAGAVQDRGRGVIIGETTLGKGSVQQPHELSDGSELRVTIARWYTPDNTSIDQQGIVPDIEVLTPEEFGTENDTQLQRAIEYIQSGQ